MEASARMLAAMTMDESALRIGATRRPRLAAAGAQRRQTEVSCFAHRPEDKLLFSHGSYSLLGMNRAGNKRGKDQDRFGTFRVFRSLFRYMRSLHRSLGRPSRESWKPVRGVLAAAARPGRRSNAGLN